MCVCVLVPNHSTEYIKSLTGKANRDSVRGKAKGRESTITTTIHLLSLLLFFLPPLPPSPRTTYTDTDPTTYNVTNYYCRICVFRKLTKKLDNKNKNKNLLLIQYYISILNFINLYNVILYYIILYQYHINIISNKIKLLWYHFIKTLFVLLAIHWFEQKPGLALDTIDFDFDFDFEFEFDSNYCFKSYIVRLYTNLNTIFFTRSKLLLNIDYYIIVCNYE
ncbi:hypothetical protein Kpol_1018p40 [Vanderwaltozyma polyspora DSM 70294]|uniref:Uncharacterized protein n=1 Tax=Vanderwaltozyma polyspora (strain ATCC 22028 / DSM 70294 / BCRC 21397 / CBS 2163 / NBRC 10782 / NRRL Y-8283 / UCD 57-17) TaxID=436907 RepID=A7TDP0_VANPO|nr:uncharacterized protein Kpol_1018p40 [Vanderwaltozyma polyspora DSM 70294]EDO19510.1 hypothetical protein Kpol_1018p40 [Vanderwaltozyma polyspora DSM 70294]